MSSYLDQYMNTLSEEELKHALAYIEIEATAEFIAGEIIKYAGANASDALLEVIIEAMQDDYRVKHAVSESRDPFSLNDWITFWFGEFGKQGKKPDQLQPKKLMHTGILFEEGDTYIKQLETFVKSFEENVIKKSEETSKTIKNDIAAFETAVNSNDREGIQKFIDTYSPYMGIVKEQIGTKDNPQIVYRYAETPVDKYGIGKGKDTAGPIGAKETGETGFSSEELSAYSSKTHDALQAIKENRIESARVAYKSVSATVQNNIEKLSEEVQGYSHQITTEFKNNLPQKYINPDQFPDDLHENIPSEYFHGGEKEEVSEIYQEEPERKGIPKRPRQAIASLENMLAQAEQGYNTYYTYLRSLKSNVFTEAEDLQKNVYEREQLIKKNKKIEGFAKKEAAVSQQLNDLLALIKDSRDKLSSIDSNYVSIANKILSGSQLTDEEAQVSSSKEVSYAQQLMQKIQEDSGLYSQLQGTLSGKAYDVQFAENEHRLKVLADLISHGIESKRASGHSEDINILNSYERQIQAYKAMLQSAKKKLEKYKIIFDALGEENPDTLPDDEIVKRLNKINTLLPKWEQVRIPEVSETDTTLATDIDEEEKNVMSESSILRLKDTLIAGLSTYEQNQENVRVINKNMLDFMKAELAKTKDAYLASKSEVKNNMIELSKESSKLLEYPEEFGMVTKRYSDREDTAEKFRKMLKNPERRHQILTGEASSAYGMGGIDDIKINNAISSSRTAIDPLIKLIDFISTNPEESATVKKTLEKHGVTVDLLRQSVNDLLNFGKENKDNIYGVDNIVKLASALKEIPKEEQVAATVGSIGVTSTEDFAKILEKAGHSLTLVSERHLNDLTDSMNILYRSINSVLGENIVDSAKLKEIFSDAGKSALLKEVLSEQAVQQYKKKVLLGSLENDSIIKKTIKKDILSQVNNLKSVLFNATKDSKTKADEASTALIGIGAGKNKDILETANTLNTLVTSTIPNIQATIDELSRNKEIIDEQLKQNGISLTGKIKDTDPDAEYKASVYAKAVQDKTTIDTVLAKLKESLNVENSKRNVLRTRLIDLTKKADMRDLRTHNFADAILYPQKKQSITYLGDLRKPSYGEYEEKRTALDILRGIYTTRDVSVSPGAVDSKNRNWYSTLSVWKTLTQQASSSILNAAASESHKYAARPNNPTPAYTAVGEGSLRNEINMVHAELQELVQKSDETFDATEKKDIETAIADKESYLEKLESILAKVPKNEEKTKDEKALVKKLNSKWSDYDTGISDRTVNLRALSTKVGYIQGILDKAQATGKYLNDEDKKTLLNERDELNYLIFRLKYDPKLSSSEISSIEKEIKLIEKESNKAYSKSLTQSYGRTSGESMHSKKEEKLLSSAKAALDNYKNYLETTKDKIEGKKKTLQQINEWLTDYSNIDKTQSRINSINEARHYINEHEAKIKSAESSIEGIYSEKTGEALSDYQEAQLQKYKDHLQALQEDSEYQDAVALLEKYEGGAESITPSSSLLERVLDIPAETIKDDKIRNAILVLREELGRYIKK